MKCINLFPLEFQLVKTARFPRNLEWSEFNSYNITDGQLSSVLWVQAGLNTCVIKRAVWLFPHSTIVAQGTVCYFLARGIKTIRRTAWRNSIYNTLFPHSMIVDRGIVCYFLARGTKAIPVTDSFISPHERSSAN